MNEVTSRIKQLMEERNWTPYRLSQESEVPAQTIHNWFSNGSYPHHPVLKQICKGFRITVADFFAEGTMVELTADKKALHDEWCSLSDAEQGAVRAMVAAIRAKK